MTQTQGILLDKRARADPELAVTNSTSWSPSSMILLLATSLITLGVVMVFTASGSLDRPFWPEEPLKSTPVRQSIFALLGIISLWLTYAVGYRFLRWRGPDIPDESPTTSSGLSHLSQQHRLFQPALLFLAFTVLCLVTALIPGVGQERHGARRWLQLGPAEYGIGFQPSELAKLAAVVFLAAWLSHRRSIMHRFKRGLIPTVVVVGLLAGLIVIEDLGTAALITLVGGIMILAAGARWWHAFLIAIPGLMGFAGMILVKPYRVERLMSHLDIWSDPLGKGYHPIQSLVTIASGGTLGQGLGTGIQKFGYLPEARNDFIFAVLCEEMGLIGGLAVIAMFLCLAILGWRIMSRAKDGFGKLLALGITMMIGFQAAMNIAVVTVSVPTKGISLPFVSAGGSGVVFYSIAVGLLASIGKTADQQPSSSAR